MPYSIAGFAHVRRLFLGNGGMWHMLRKDLLQIAEMPSHFSKADHPDLASNPNLCMSILSMSGLEAMARFANIDGHERPNPNRLAGPFGNATESVVAFGKRYLVRANPLYTGPLIRLVWDAYRNGGVHRFLPKASRIVFDDGIAADIVFSVGCYEKNDDGKVRSWSISELRELRQNEPSPKGHLCLVKQHDCYQFWINPQFAILELEQAVDNWAVELEASDELKNWFINAINAHEQGIALNRHPDALDCLEQLYRQAQRR